MVSQDLIKWVSIPDPENEDLKFNESKYLEIQQIEVRYCPFCGNRLHRRVDTKKESFRCRSKHCKNRVKLAGERLADSL